MTRRTPATRAAKSHTTTRPVAKAGEFSIGDFVMLTFHGPGYSETEEAPRLVVDLPAHGIVKVTEHEVDDNDNFGPTTHASHYDFDQSGREVNAANSAALSGFRVSIRHATQAELDALPASAIKRAAAYLEDLGVKSFATYVRGRAR